MVDYKSFSVALYAKKGDKLIKSTLDAVSLWLDKHEIIYKVFLCPSPNLEDSLKFKASIAVVLGGDGTIISVAKHFLGKKTPIMGINFGRVGFLAEISPSNWEDAFKIILEKEINSSPRFAIRYEVYRDNGLLLKGYAINDAVVTRGKVARLVDFNCSCENSMFNLRADGMVFSTPTGSTGYCRSTGGPLVNPNLNCYVVSAICPFLHNFPPLVLYNDSKFELEICNKNANVFLTIDGHEAHPLKSGDRVLIYGGDKHFYMADLGYSNYFDRLLKAGFLLAY